jgi:hypothetical protein
MQSAFMLILVHMRGKCEWEHPRYRICLDNPIASKVHECSNVIHCAQCEGPHHSLSISLLTNYIDVHLNFGHKRYHYRRREMII